MRRHARAQPPCIRRCLPVASRPPRARNRRCAHKTTPDAHLAALRNCVRAPPTIAISRAIRPYGPGPDTAPRGLGIDRGAKRTGCQAATSRHSARGSTSGLPFTRGCALHTLASLLPAVLLKLPVAIVCERRRPLIISKLALGGAAAGCKGALSPSGHDCRVLSQREMQWKWNA